MARNTKVSGLKDNRMVSAYSSKMEKQDGVDGKMVPNKAGSAKTNSNKFNHLKLKVQVLENLEDEIYSFLLIRTQRL